MLLNYIYITKCYWIIYLTSFSFAFSSSFFFLFLSLQTLLWTRSSLNQSRPTLFRLTHQAPRVGCFLQCDILLKQAGGTPGVPWEVLEEASKGFFFKKRLSLSFLRRDFCLDNLQCHLQNEIKIIWSRFRYEW